MSKELVKREPQNAVPPFNIESIFSLAIEKQGTAETLEKLMAIRRELNAEASKKAFDEAMAAFQAECPPVKKSKSVSTGSGVRAYSYAPLEQIISVVKPYLEKHGFSYAFDTDTSSQAGWVIAKCDVTHSGGHTVSKTAKFPLGTKTNIMSETQVYAAALTFASRRVFQNSFGIVCEGEDMDGRTAAVKPSLRTATPATLKWFLEQTEDLAQQRHEWAINKAYIMPDEGIDKFPLEHCPTTKAELAAVRKEIENT